MTAKRTDANQAEIVAGFRKAGCEVTLTHMVGQGFTDCVCSHAASRPAGQNFLFEIKVKGGRLTDDEIKWHRRWPGQKAVIYCVEDGLRIMGLLKEAA